MNHYARILFEELGTSASPNPKREDFLNFIENYKTAKEAVEFMKSLEKSLIDQPQVQSFTYSVDYDSNDEGGTTVRARVNSITNIEGVVMDDDHDDYEDLEEELSDLLYYMPEDIIHTLEDNEIGLQTMNKLSFLTEEEEKAYNMVEFFERDTLNEKIPESVKSKKEHKI